MRGVGLAVVLLLATFGRPALAANGCAATGNDDTLRPLLTAMAPAAVSLFQLQSMPLAEVVKSTVTRCMDGERWACNLGADLPCGKAKVARTSPASADWCRQNPDVDFIPAYITGQNSVYSWRCTAGAPATVGPAQALDSRGFLKKDWRLLN